MAENNYENNITKETKVKNNYLSKTLKTIILLGALHLASYEYTRPTVKGEVLGGQFSNQEKSQVFVKNYETNNIDTLVLNTTPSNLVDFVWANPEDFKGQADALENKLQPGTMINAKLHKNNQVYKFDTILQTKKPQQNSQENILAIYK